MGNNVHNVVEALEKNDESYANYRNVYANLIDDVDEVLNDISKINLQHIDVKKINDEVQSELQHLRSDFIKKLKKLDQNAVWDKFTISFFGETNAGKSTIIEALRISMLEDQKLKNAELKKSLDCDIAELIKRSEKIKTSILDSRTKQIKILTSQLVKLRERAKGLENTFFADGLALIRSWFGLLPISFYKKRISLLEGEIYDLKTLDPEQDDEVVELMAKANEFITKRKELYDGKIIGTGRQDFTQSCIEYQFNQDPEPFTLIDMPGIEGNEGKYETMIMDAVSKAHCVFYVCSAGKLPESGTIAKIRKYLNEQTEVYFLLNERKNTYRYEDVFTFEAMHPSAEKFRTDISTQMEEELGEFFKGCYSLQGLMAFCSKAEIFEEERNYKFQKKLLDQFGTFENLYSISQLEKVETIIRSQLEEMQSKIINANFQKAVCAANDFKNKIQEIRNTKYSDNFVRNIEKEIKVAKDKNENSYGELKHGLSQVINKLSKSSLGDLREKLYDLVNKDGESLYRLNLSDRTKARLIKDKEKRMKFVTNCYGNYVLEKLSKNYADSTEIICNSFTREVKENINKMKSNIKQITFAELLSDLDRTAIENIDVIINFDWRKFQDRAMSIGSMALSGIPFGPWGVAIGAAVGLLFVGIRWWFMERESSKSKAKKHIDEKLAVLKAEMNSKLEASNKNIIDDCRKNIIDEVRIMLDCNIRGIKAIQGILETKTNQLEILIEEVKTYKK